MGRGQEVTSSRSGWGECGRHARERRAHAPGPRPRRWGDAARRLGRERETERVRAADSRVSSPGGSLKRPRRTGSRSLGLRGPRGARPLVQWLGPGDGLLGNQTVAVAFLLSVEPKPGGLEKHGREL
ncbi:unnamed protein product [Rangifer tarandus platyrhynchus]|uniref:Uncharacterized protein n=2 Tax=Rangifer tarandus platyrhynchus TaxID=3082113 RepID=A0ABN8YGN6_RANTA|nr:unnamed protein product [Rangifer tarandus platyrhynchus]CAI9699069.1 unnamed protein product [Rangifer tarandus platyrhynchus]